MIWTNGPVSAKAAKPFSKILRFFPSRNPAWLVGVIKSLIAELTAQQEVASAA